MIEKAEWRSRWFFLLLESVILSVCLSLNPGRISGKDGTLFPVLSSIQGFGSLTMALPFLIGTVLTLAERNPHARALRRVPGLWALSVAFGVLNASGQWMYAVDRLPRTFIQHLAFWLYALACAVVFQATARLLLAWIPHALGNNAVPEGKRENRRFVLTAFAVILAGWLPWLISYYPMSADYDVYKPIAQYLGLSVKSNDFPWFYCTLVGSFYRLGELLGDKNIGMFLLTFLRAIMMAGIYASLALRLRKRDVRKGIVWAVILFYALVPVWGAYAKHAFKDTWAAALFCWYTMETIEVATCLRRKQRNALPYLCYGLSALAISLFRGNCVYIAIPVTLALVIAVLRAGFGRGAFRVCALLLSGLILWGGYQVYIRKVEHVAPGTMSSALTIPFQQTARTFRDYGDEITAEEREQVGSVLDTAVIGERYDPLISDPVKDTVHHLKENLFVYAGAWFRMGLRFPVSYLEAAIGQSYGYYAMTGDQAYHAGSWNCGMTIFNWVKDPRYTDDFTCDYIQTLQPLRDLLDRWAQVWHQLPLLGLSDLKAIYTWLILLAGYALLRRRKGLEFLPVFALLLNILFCCCSPVNDTFRYFAPVAAATPALLLLLGERRNGFQDSRIDD